MTADEITSYFSELRADRAVWTDGDLRLMPKESKIIDELERLALRGIEPSSALELLREARQYVVERHFHTKVLTNGVEEIAPCERCNLREKIDAAISGISPQP